MSQWDVCHAEEGASGLAPSLTVPGDGEEQETTTSPILGLLEMWVIVYRYTRIEILHKAIAIRAFASAMLEERIPTYIS